MDKEITFEVIKDIYWDDWGHFQKVFSKGDIYKGTLHSDGTVTAESPYYEGISDYVDSNLIVILDDDKFNPKEDKVLKWSNGAEWGEIEHPELGMVMTYWRAGTPCYDTYTAPMVDADGDMYCYRFDQDEGWWKEDTIYIGTYEGEEEIAFR